MQEDTGMESSSSIESSDTNDNKSDHQIRTFSGPAAGATVANDLASDVSMTSDSDSDASTRSDAPQTMMTEPQHGANGTENMLGAMDMASKKRKSPGDDSEDSPTGELSTSEAHKKARLDSGPGGNAQVSDRALLPPEVWHHIFTFCPPKTLGNLLSVNKLFHQYLNPSSSTQIDHPPSASQGVLSVLKPNHIWQSSRRLFWPHMPAPLRSLSELSMWKMLCSTKCQECNKSDVRDPEAPADTLHGGPGLAGVTAIWPFALRSCGPCLLRKTVKEIDILLSSTIPSTLMPALPFVHTTKELNVVSLSAIEQGQLPPNVDITKLFLASDVDEIKKEFFAVKGLGPGTLEEWFKGLESRGQTRLNEARKWEKWANTGSLQHVRLVADPYMSAEPTIQMNMSSKMGHLQRGTAHPRQERTLEEVSELKAARKAEIERRAALLEPPLLPNVIRHMVSFQAATQLITALDESAWELLKPRLLAERSEAEGIENSISQQIRTIQEQDKNSHLEATLATTKEAKDAVDREWEEVQAPLRARIVSYADEIIRTGWDRGKKVKQDNCARFAAEALVYIRKRFYAEVAKDAAAAKAAGKEPLSDPPQGPFTQKLTLENMRWIFDTKIKPITAPLRREVFYCNGCAAKPFGFEGVVQHYAAKHTDTLSSGNIVVHWRCEWPEEPPFNPEGRTKVIYPTPGNASHPSGTGPLQTYPFNNYAPPPAPGVPPPSQPILPPYGAAPPYAEPYAPQYPGYPQPANYGPPAAPGFPPQPYAPPQPGWGPYNPYQTGPVPNGPYAHNPTPPQPVGYQQHIPMPGPVPVPVPGPGPAPVPGPFGHAPSPYQGNGVGGYTPSLPPYQVQLEDIARNSREVWNATANIRDLPGSARVFVTIHHVVKRFRSRFSETPALTIFQDGLSNHKDMRPVRNINALSCKACQLNLGNAAYVQEDRKSFSLPQLVNHFKTKHVEAMQKAAPDTPPLDWTVDMILPPGHAALAKLRGAIGSHGLRYQLFRDAFPEVFGHTAASPAPPFYGQHQPLTQYQQGPHYSAPILPPSTDNHEKFYGQPDGNNVSQGHPDAAGQNSYEQQGGAYPQNHPTNGYAPIPAQAPVYQPEQGPRNPAVASITDYEDTRREGNGSVSSQNGSSGPRPSHSGKWARKNKNKNNSVHNKHSGPDAKIKEEEPKMPEEEKAREEEIKAMWATDRVATARASQPSVRPEEGESGKTTLKVEQNRPKGAIRGARGDLQQQGAKPSVQRSGNTSREEPDLLGALEMHLGQGREPLTQSDKMREQEGVIYMTGSQDGLAPGVQSRLPEQYDGRHASIARPPSPRGRFDELPRSDHTQQRDPDHRQSDNGYYSQPPAPVRARAGYGFEQGRDQCPPAQHASVPSADYDGQRRYGRGYPTEDQPMYDRLSHPPVGQEYRHRPSYAADLAPPPSRGPPTGQLYEIVEVIDSQGSYLIRRPIARAPPPEPAYYDYPYETERPRERQPPIGTGRDGQEPYPPRPSGDDGYDPPLPQADHRAPPPHQQYRDEYPLGLSSARPSGADYPPHQYQRDASRAAPAPAPHDGDYPPQQYQRAASRPAPAAGYREEEYDPRFPAAPPPPPPGRRLIRYD